MGFSLHAATTASADDSRGREALVRYALRPPIAQERLHIVSDDLVRSVPPALYEPQSQKHSDSRLFHLRAGVGSTTLNLSAYSYISVSAQVASSAYFNVQLSDASGQYCYWSFFGNGATKTYLVDLANPSYCGSMSLAKAQIQNIDFTTNYDYADDFTIHIYSVTFM